MRVAPFVLLLHDEYYVHTSLLFVHTCDTLYTRDGYILLLLCVFVRPTHRIGDCLTILRIDWSTKLANFLVMDI